MAGRKKTIPFKRKRTGKTDYRKRLKLLISHTPRLVIRKSNKNITAQIIQYNPEGDKILVSAHSRELTKMGWKARTKNLPAAYLTGLLCGIKAKKAGIKKVILDTGMYASTKGSIIYATLKGITETNITIPHSKEILPPNERIMGEHITKYAKSLSEEKHKKQFSKYEKEKFELENMKKNIEEVKTKILGK